MRFFGLLFGIIWLSIWVFAISMIIKSIKHTSQAGKFTRDVNAQLQNRLREINIHTGDPKNPYVRKSPAQREEPTSDDFSEVPQKSKSDENAFNGLNPKTDKRVYKTRKKTTLNGRKTRRADRVYGVGSSEMPLHGKLSQETRDDEKEWF